MKHLAFSFFMALSGCSAADWHNVFTGMSVAMDGASNAAPLAMDTAYLVNGTVPPPGYYQPTQQSTVVTPYQTLRRSMVPNTYQPPVSGPQYRPLSQ